MGYCTITLLQSLLLSVSLSDRLPYKSINCSDNKENVAIVLMRLYINTNIHKYTCTHNNTQYEHTHTKISSVIKFLLASVKFLLLFDCTFDG